MIADSQPQDSSNVSNKWSEIIEDLWEKLPHFQEIKQSYMYYPKSDYVQSHGEADDIPWILRRLPRMEEPTDSATTNCVSQTESE